jgi:hypothetical protein
VAYVTYSADQPDIRINVHSENVILKRDGRMRINDPL